jgi:hypothetical protein
MALYVNEIIIAKEKIRPPEIMTFILGKSGNITLNFIILVKIIKCYVSRISQRVQRCRTPHPSSLRSWDNSTNNLQCTLFLKLGSHYFVTKIPLTYKNAFPILRFTKGSSYQSVAFNGWASFNWYCRTTAFFLKDSLARNCKSRV